MATLEIANVRYEKHDFWRFTLDWMKSWQKLNCFGLELVFFEINMTFWVDLYYGHARNC